MAKLKATPKTYAEALAVLNGNQSTRLGHNTYLTHYVPSAFNAEEHIAVRLHSTDIVKFFPSGKVTLHTGGYRTVTTKERLNQFVPGRVYQQAHVWYYAPAGERPIDAKQAVVRAPLEFTEGMNVGVCNG